ncbi:MAG: anaerobic ribonucleoside-triphosphate reductase activating protein [Spirochaetia bacterium]|nr:anaerobic ribonucleoside-triphosphate reductase activating protein [Spirochaetia bacterium]
MRINGFEGISVIDYPGKIASIIYTSPCNFACPFCHNPGLIKVNDRVLEQDDVFEELAGRAGFVEGVVITGGEPTLQLDLADFMAALRSMGLKVKLDTNGYRPQALAEIFERGVADYVAMDIKTSPERYSEACGAKVEVERVRESIKLIMNSGVDYEFRTTLVPGFIQAEDADKIGAMINGAKQYSLQQFSNAETFSPSLSSTVPFSESFVEAFAARMRHYAGNVRITGRLAAV